jgi:hypothetical protein
MPLVHSWSVALQTDAFPQKILDPVNRRATRARNGKPMRPVDSHRKTTARGAQWLVCVWESSCLAGCPPPPRQAAAECELSPLFGWVKDMT